MVLFYLLLCFVFLLVYLQYLCNYTPEARIFQKIPGPTGLPITGNLFSFVHKPVPLFYIGRHLANRFKKIYGVQIAHTRGINIYQPDDVEFVLSSSKYITKSPIYDILHPWLKEGLLTSKGELWHKRRKILTPAFHFNVLRQFCKVFEEQAQGLIDLIKSQKSQVVSVTPIVTQFALASICETAMGTQLNSDSKAQQYKKAIYKLGNVFVHKFVRFWYRYQPIYRFSHLYKEQTEHLKILHDFTTSVIRQRRTERDSGQGVQIIHEEDLDKDDYIKSNKKRLAMLDLLLSAEAEGRIDEAGIREEVDTFMFEGHDTTSMGISFALMRLANEKFVQDKIIEELDKIFEDPNRTATTEDLNDMKYLELCIKESLRLYPSVPFISRILEEDIQLQEFLIPEQTLCHIHIYDLHRNASLFPNPDEFIPERFTLENSAKRHPFAYVPFSAGPRNCIGQKFAMLEMKSVISSILRNFSLEPVTTPKDIVFSADIVLRCRDPIYVKFVPRN